MALADANGAPAENVVGVGDTVDNIQLVKKRAILWDVYSFLHLTLHHNAPHKMCVRRSYKHCQRVREPVPHAWVVR